MGGEVNALLDADQIGSFGCRCAVPGAGPRGRDRHLGSQAPRFQGPSKQPLGDGAPAGVASADEENMQTKPRPTFLKKRKR